MTTARNGTVVERKRKPYTITGGVDGRQRRRPSDRLRRLPSTTLCRLRRRRLPSTNRRHRHLPLTALDLWTLFTAACYGLLSPPPPLWTTLSAVTACHRLIVVIAAYH